jgi:formate dehydrogenase subunit gamma
MPVRSAWTPALVEEIMRPLLTLEGPLLPILHAVQKTFGHVPEAAVPLIAARLNLTRAEVHGVVSFYHDFRDAPAGRHVLKLCQAEACQSMGAARQTADLLARLGLRAGETTPDGRLTIEPVYCLGLCATAPAALLDDEPHGRLDAAALETLAAVA